MGWQNLDRNDAVEPSIAGAIHFAYPTRTDGGEDFLRP